MAYNTIVLKGRGIRKEAQAGGAIVPGMLVKLNSSGKYIAHNLASGVTTAAFAVENELAGEGIDTAYASNDRCFVEVPQKGGEVYALVAASAAAIAIGDVLVSAGDGTLKKVVDLTAAAGTPVANGTMADVGGSPSQTTINNALATAAALVNNPGAIAIALEAVDNSANGDTRARIIVEVL